LFGSRELFLEKTCEIAQRALSSAHDIALSPSCVASIRRTVDYLNGKIDSYNAARRVQYVAAPIVSHLAIPEHAFHVDEQVTSVSPPVCGIVNTGNKCYLISTLLALCGSEELKKELAQVANPSDANVQLRLVFRQLESTDASWLSLFHEPFSGLIDVLGKVFLPLRGGAFPFPCGAQQDAHEVMLHLLEVTLGKTDLIHFREIVIRGPVGHISDGNIVLPDNVFIPSIDSKALDRRDAAISTENILQVMIPKLHTRRFPLEMIFRGVPGIEDVEVKAILGNEENIGKIPPDLCQRLQQVGEKGGGKLNPLPVVRRHILCGEPPSVLPLQLVRFRTQPVTNHVGVAVGFRREKIKTFVEVPFHLSVPVIGRVDQRYVVRGIVVHLGESIESGHYVACIPDLQSSRDHNGMPTVWKYYNDGQAVERRLWESLSETVAKNGYLYIYDKVV
jgi:ubiquitin C-terminal hydrolase